jgi:hypothetical protein
VGGPGCPGGGIWAALIGARCITGRDIFRRYQLSARPGIQGTKDEHFFMPNGQYCVCPAPPPLPACAALWPSRREIIPGEPTGRNDRERLTHLVVRSSFS